MNTKFKNVHYLNKYPSIESEFKASIEMLYEKNAAECYFHLKMCVLGLETLLIKDTEWYKSNKKVGYKPTHDEILRRFEKENILTSKQIDLFTTINNLSESYDYYDKNKLKKKQRIETLNILCTRLDNEIPSIMAHLGVGGASRLDYLKNVDSNNKVVVKESKEEAPKENPKQTTESTSKYKRSSLYIWLRYRWYRIAKWFNRPFGFFIKFILVSAVFVLLVNVTFINRDKAEAIKDFADNNVPKETEYIKDTFSNIPDAVGDTLEVICDGVISFFEFLKFE